MKFRKSPDASAVSKQKLEGGIKSVLCSLLVHYSLHAKLRSMMLNCLKIYLETLGCSFRSRTMHTALLYSPFATFPNVLQVSILISFHVWIMLHVDAYMVNYSRVYSLASIIQLFEILLFL